MENNIIRRNFLKTLLATPALATGNIFLTAQQFDSSDKYDTTLSSNLKVSLNAYSFNTPLRNGSMTLHKLLEFCALHEFDAVDLTGYYFPGYPTVPPDENIFNLKQKAFRLGLDISGTGVKNDFTNPDENKRKEDITLIKKWIECAGKLGAPVIRIFSGTQIPIGYTWSQVSNWMVKDIIECVNYGKKYGVIVAIQNHNDFIKTADEAQKIIEAVNSEWFGLVLDIGSYRGEKPYDDIKQTAKFAVNWQLKENMFFSGIEQKTDLKKILTIIKSSGYRGYLPIETLGTGDPKIMVPLFLKEVRKALKYI